jgi:hypothetical protein
MIYLESPQPRIFGPNFCPRFNPLTISTQSRMENTQQQHQINLSTNLSSSLEPKDEAEPMRWDYQNRTTMQLIHGYAHNFTWSWFIWPMASLGLSILISALPYRFDGLTVIGIIVYLFGVMQYTIILFFIIARFSLHSGSLQRSLSRTSETLFFSTVS